MNRIDAEATIRQTEQTLLTYCARQGLFSPGDRVVAACSGGADSVALLLFLLRCREELGITVLAAHVDHGIRGASAHADAAFVRELCRQKGVPLFLYDAVAQGVKIPAHPSEDWARRLRYTWFDALAGAEHALIATAHTRSDQAETVLFRLARGTGVHGLAGIPPRRGAYRRPFLCLTRAQTVAYCAALGAGYVQDETNDLDAYARNRLRHDAIPALQYANPAAERSIARLCDRMRALDAWLDSQAKALLEAAATPCGYRLEALRGAEGPVLDAALQTLVAERDPDEETVGRLRALVARGRGAVQLTQSVRWRAKNGELRKEILPPHPPVPAPPQPAGPGEYRLPGGYRLRIWVENYEEFLKNASIYKKDLTFWADYAKIKKNIRLRTRQPGDSYRPAGRNLRKTLKKYYNETAVPTAERPLLPLLAADSEVLWLWNAGFADGLQPDALTREVLLVRAEKTGEDSPVYNMNDDIDHILVSREQLEAKVAELGARISRDYDGKDLLLVSILKGSVTFMADLMRVVTVPCSIDFMVVSSYGGANTSSTGLVKIVKDLDADLTGKDVLIVEDILDTGITLSKLLPMLKLRNPSSIKLCTILSKPSRRKADIAPDYLGFEVPDEFVVGYGLDFDEKYRNLPYVGVLKPEVYSDRK